MARIVSLKIPYHRLIIVFFFSILGSIHIKCQETWTTDQLLDYDQGRVEIPYQDNLDFLNNKAKGMPFIGKYEFRTETDEMELAQQQYQFRFDLNSRDERKAYDKILAANAEKYSLFQSVQELDLLEEKYSNIIDLYFNQKEMELIQEDLLLLSDKRIVLKKIIENESLIDVNDWLSLENEIFRVQSDSLELGLEKYEIVYKILGPNREIAKIDDSNFIQIETLKKIALDKINDKILHPDQAIAVAEENIANAEYNLEEAEANKWLEFLQVQYSAENNLSFQREFSFGTSIVIPNKNNNRVKKNDAILELLESKYKTRREEEEKNRQIKSDEVKLIGLINQLEEFKSMVNSQELESMFSSYSEKKIVSPLVLLDLKRSILKNKSKQLNFEKDIYETYIGLLSKKAILIETPRINYLSELGK